MATISSMNVFLVNTQGAQTTAEVETKTWTKADARSRALKWGGGIVVICLCMLPIPLVHFAIIPVFFVGLPVVAFGGQQAVQQGH